ncbi:MAG: polysaccharide deacetylase family protein [Firmicutes bacterium]|nr:polysaccharide deacetylase family protein [Bacillota bacterium]
MKKMSRFGAVLAALLFGLAIFTAFSSPVISWGVVPNTREEPPEPPAYGAELLAAHDGFYLGDTSQKKVYFTFDLGYEAGYTAEVLDLLAEHDIKAAFFLCSNYLQESELVSRMLAEGHQIGNHTDRHKDLPTLGDEGIKTDIATMGEKFAAQYGGAPLRFFRPPQGRFCERTLKTAESLGLKTTLWSIAIVDWGREPIDPVKNAEKIASRLHPGAVVLFHITNSGTPKMLKLLLPKIAEKGYGVGEPGELVKSDER